MIKQKKQCTNSVYTLHTPTFSFLALATCRRQIPEPRPESDPHHLRHPAHQLRNGAFRCARPRAERPSRLPAPRHRRHRHRRPDGHRHLQHHHRPDGPGRPGDLGLGPEDQLRVDERSRHPEAGPVRALRGADVGLRGGEVCWGQRGGVLDGPAGGEVS